MMKREDIRLELLRRQAMDQAARLAVANGSEEAFARLLAIDDENARWLGRVIRTIGWPRRSVTGEDGSHAAWLLAQHADRRPWLQRRCLALLRRAVRAGEASPADLAHLTDRVLLARGKPQIYGTQLVARDGRYVPRRLRDPENVDERRSAAGLESLQLALDQALELYKPPSPVAVRCRSCQGEIPVWLPEPGVRLKVECSACGSGMTLRLRYGRRAREG